MSIIFQCAIIFSFSFAGEALRVWLPLPIPAGVYGFVLFLIALATKAVKLRQVETVGQFFVSLLPLIFIPVLVGALDVPSLPAKVLGSIGLLTVVSTVAVMAVSGLVTQFCLQKGRRDE